MIANVLIVLGVACIAVGAASLALRLAHGRPDGQADAPSEDNPQH